MGLGGEVKFRSLGGRAAWVEESTKIEEMVSVHLKGAWQMDTMDMGGGLE